VCGFLHRLFHSGIFKLAHQPCVLVVLPKNGFGLCLVFIACHTYLVVVKNNLIKCGQNKAPIAGALPTWGSCYTE